MARKRRETSDYFCAESSLENISFAGKCGSLLIKLSADETDQLNYAKVKAHAQICGINGTELPVYLKTLKAEECLDWDSKTQLYEVLPFSRERVLETTSKIFASIVGANPAERVLPGLLEYCLLRPRLHSEAKEFLSALLAEQDADHLLGLVGTYSLLGTEVLLGSLAHSRMSLSTDRSTKRRFCPTKGGRQ
ncbi:MAG TPA: hypothetical protein VJ180_14515 [Pyrinomonadaceae bacterium]|nr:hypothetical protein [Pyrinomonadaceae bacterium]